MKPILRAWMLVAVALTLTGCDDDETDSPTVEVENLSTGFYVVSVGNVDAPTVGKYYAGADGSRLLLLADSDDRVNRLYRRNNDGDWVAVPAENEDVNVTLLDKHLQAASTPALATLAGRYAARVSASSTAIFSLEADGDIVAGASDCKLGGKLSAGSLPGALRLSLTAANCGALPASSSGVLVVDRDDAPADFRLIADDEAALIDLRAYRE